MTSAELGVVLDRLSDGVAVLDTDWSIGYANPAAARLLGRPGEELAGRNLWMALPELAGTALHAFLLHAQHRRVRTLAGFLRARRPVADADR